MTNFKRGKIASYAGASVLVVGLVACGNTNPPAPQPPPGVSSLSGNYVFSVTGTDPADGDYSVLGSFAADGKGNITSAVADYNLGSGVDSNVALTGTYTATAGTATITLMDSGVVKDSFTAVLVTSGSTPVANFDGSGSGTLYPQVTSGFATAGTYSLSLKGEGDGAITGSGQLVAATGGAFSSGTLTLSDAQTSTTYSAVTGYLAAPATTTGRGFANLEGNNLAYYVIGPNQIQMMGLDARYLLTIPAQKM